MPGWRVILISPTSARAGANAKRHAIAKNSLNRILPLPLVGAEIRLFDLGSMARRACAARDRGAIGDIRHRLSPGPFGAGVDLSAGSARKLSSEA
jgi:hypothetical protein